VRRVALILVLALTAVAAGCGGSNDDTATSTTATPPTTTATTSTATVGADGCSDVPVPAARKNGGETKPKERLDPEVTYKLVFTTNCGSFTVTLDQAKAPATTASLVSLAKAGFYDNTIFHRIVPDFVIQAGDPTQSGSGGPGYETLDPPPSDTKYDKGVVAMAKTGAEPAGTAGSQFFVVSGPNAATLPPDYAVVGNVTNGMDTVDRNNGFGDASDPNGTPTRPVVIESVTVEQT